MAEKKQKHGRVERHKPRQRLRFRLEGVFFLVVLSFAVCFGLHMRQALTTENYWHDEIAAPAQEKETEPAPGNTAQVVNPVPASERAPESRLSLCAWVGDEPALSDYFKAASDMYVSDAVSGMSESAMRSAAKSLGDPIAVYLWMAPAEEVPDLAALTRIFRFEMPDVPIYILSSLPVESRDLTPAVDKWNSELFAAADACGIHFVDVSTSLKANDGTLSTLYEDKADRYKAVQELILTHVDD